ncbi:MAG: Undecaprenyl-phosphate glucose phosphotransferase [Candidatus Uhrbacteria bacterium GW2011_GWD2_52_7]|uniref:Undecaprenyl-phosphate glucose phosphotransferase n=1 Tax=Candidatus Uhrbacteria bacterium GW2011_GWD2_52_7 TaxID=1618989 RepID=A0A0G1XG03_9BACT|nr:MAG: Undecaprenyl-phosphate glucose phosphotransferase [Candidatus Uhrbacteria bacterium GW2011_GWD2_52_7]
MKRADLAFAALLVPLDYVTLIAAATAAYSLRFADVFTSIKPVIFDLTYNEYLRAVLPVAAVYLGIFALAGLYAMRPRRVAVEMSRIFLACSTGIAAVLAIAFFSREIFESRFIVLAVWALSILFVIIERVLVRTLQRSLRSFGVGTNNVVIVGKTKIGNDLHTYFNDHPSHGYQVVGQITHFSTEARTRLLDLLQKQQLDAVILANSDAARDEVQALKVFADTQHVTFLYSAELFAGSTLRPIIHTYAGQPIIEVPKTPLDGWGAIYKRIFDIIGALLLIVVSLPIQIIAAIALFIESPGSILFSTLPNGGPVTRVGQGGRPFRYFKFRSMVRDAHKYRFDPEFVKKHGNLREGSPLFKLEHDPRVTRVGRFIRKLSIDEIPEFYLVLRGSMSLVGPRPHLPEEVARYRPEQRKVLTIKPGITGMAQVSGRANLDFEDEVRLDMHYIENWTPWLDLVILAKTPLAVLGHAWRSGIG